MVFFSFKWSVGKEEGNLKVAVLSFYTSTPSYTYDTTRTEIIPSLLLSTSHYSSPSPQLVTVMAIQITPTRHDADEENSRRSNSRLSDDAPRRRVPSP